MRARTPCDARAARALEAPLPARTAPDADEKAEKDEDDEKRPLPAPSRWGLEDVDEVAATPPADA